MTHRIAISIDRPHTDFAQLHITMDGRDLMYTGATANTLLAVFEHVRTEERALNGVLGEIAAERRRQKEVEGWSLEHDDKHVDGEMSAAAACYMLHSVRSGGWFDRYISTIWPWAKDWFKPKGWKRDLVRAGALLVAEYERRQRVEVREFAKANNAEHLLADKQEGTPQ